MILSNIFFLPLEHKPTIHLEHQIFPGCVAKGSRFTLGVWGWRHVRSRLLCRPQPSATVHNRSQPSAALRGGGSMAVPTAIAAKRVYTLYTAQTPHFTLHTLHFTLNTLHVTPYTLHSTSHDSHSALSTPYSTRYLHSALYTLHVSLHTLHFTLYTLLFTLPTL